MPPLRLASLSRPRGLAARAVLLVTGLMALTAALCVSVVLIGADREGARQQLAITHDLTTHLAQRVAELIARGNVQVLPYIIKGAVQRDDVRAISLRDAQGRVLAEAGGTPEDARLIDQLAARALQEGAEIYSREGGVLTIAAPIVLGEEKLGVAVRMWEADAYRFDPISSLAPFLTLLGLLALVALPITAMLVRKAIAPLDELSRFAERIAQDGHAEPIALRTGDEFETLAKAFNRMIGRIDESMRRIQEIAFVDPATQLPNLDRFVREVDYNILNAKGGAAGVVALFELQRLPKLMQTLDPSAARDFLRAVSERLTAATRTVDSVVRLRAQDEPAAVAARIGVVEFAVFAPGLAEPADAARFAQHLNAALNQPFEWRGHKLTLGACCGVALAPRDGRDADAVIRHARMALGAASQAAGKLKVFTQSLDREAMARLTLEREMRGALENNEFRAYFQPKINLANGRIGACEALARWVRPDRTIISPGRFIPVAEESGLIGALSDAIMREACWKAAAWARAGHHTNVSVNVSALQFRNDRFAEGVLRIVEHAGLVPHRLELEITESVVMEDPDRALHLIKPLREAGVRLAIDDFGCGHSSLSALSRLPFDVIKIDQQFVRALERGEPEGEAIIDMIIALADRLNMEIVAEGVERPEEAEFMARRGCHWVQGFLYGAAVSAPEFAEMLRRQAGEEITAIDAA
jgi:EAL domain-containing protein (putative c-di-GMP-specific phosphodiesterase class I)/GGDEF domain-containing protein